MDRTGPAITYKLLPLYAALLLALHVHINREHKVNRRGNFISSLRTNIHRRTHPRYRRFVFQPHSSSRVKQRPVLLEPISHPLATAIVLVQYRRYSRRTTILLVRVEYQTGMRIEDYHVLTSDARAYILDSLVHARRSHRQYRSCTPGQRPRR